MVFLDRHCHSDAPSFSHDPPVVFFSIQKALYSRSHCGFCGYSFICLLSCIVGQNSTVVVARLRLCIIVSCFVDRKRAGASIYEVSRLRQRMSRKPLALLSTDPGLTE